MFVVVIVINVMTIVVTTDVTAAISHTTVFGIGIGIAIGGTVVLLITTILSSTTSFIATAVNWTLLVVLIARCRLATIVTIR